MLGGSHPAGLIMAKTSRRGRRVGGVAWGASRGGLKCGGGWTVTQG